MLYLKVLTHAGTSREDGRPAPATPLWRWWNIHTYIRGDGESVTEILDESVDFAINAEQCGSN